MRSRRPLLLGMLSHILFPQEFDKEVDGATVIETAKAS